MKFYALVNEKKPTVFLLIANSTEGLNAKIDKAYWSSRGMTSKSSKYELSDYLNGKKKVIVTIEDFNHD